MTTLIYRDARDDAFFSFVIGWAETNNIPYETRTARGIVQVGLSPYHWRKAEYLGIA